MRKEHPPAIHGSSEQPPFFTGHRLMDKEQAAKLNLNPKKEDKDKKPKPPQD